MREFAHADVPRPLVGGRLGETDGGPGQPPPLRVRDALYRISQGLPLPKDFLRGALLELAAVQPGRVREGFLAALMMGLMARGPVEDEVVEVLSAALSLDAHQAVKRARIRGGRLLVVAGSGKKGLKTFNISTPSAIVAVAAGASVVKVGSAATSSVMGSRDLAGCLRLAQYRAADGVLAAVARTGFAFVPVEEMIPAVDALYGGRFHMLTPFGFGLAALVPPVRGDVVVYGLAHPRVDLAARVLGRLGVSDAVVVASGTAEGYFADEFGLGDRSLLCALHDGRVGEVTSYATGDLPGLGAADRVQPCPPVSSAEAVRWVLDAVAGRGPAARVQLVALNAAVLLLVAGLARDLRDGHHQAMAAISSGRALVKLEELQQQEAVCRQLT